jgi:hypothetical protein
MIGRFVEDASITDGLIFALNTSKTFAETAFSKYQPRLTHEFQVRTSPQDVFLLSWISFAYGPDKPLFDKTWVLPDLKAVK